MWLYREQKRQKFQRVERFDMVSSFVVDLTEALPQNWSPRNTWSVLVAFSGAGLWLVIKSRQAAIYASGIRLTHMCTRRERRKNTRLIISDAGRLFGLVLSLEPHHMRVYMSRASLDLGKAKIGYWEAAILVCKDYIDQGCCPQHVHIRDCVMLDHVPCLVFFALIAILQLDRVLESP